VFFRYRIPLIYRSIWGGEAFIYEIYFGEEGRDGSAAGEGVGAGGGQPGSNAREGRSLHDDRHVDVDLTQGGGQHDTIIEEDFRDGRNGEV
jgi:hypothetical protein